jgi:hypothetical protein
VVPDYIAGFDVDPATDAPGAERNTAWRGVQFPAIREFVSNPSVHPVARLLLKFHFWPPVKLSVARRCGAAPKKCKPKLPPSVMAAWTLCR